MALGVASLAAPQQDKAARAVHRGAVHRAALEGLVCPRPLFLVSKGECPLRLGLNSGAALGLSKRC